MTDSKRKILIIEDDEIIRTVLAAALKKRGNEVVSCVLLREATVMLEQESYDLIISDIGLPDGDGLEFCSKYRGLPFISMSASDCELRAQSLGAGMFIQKPFDLDEMLCAVEQIMNH